MNDERTEIKNAKITSTSIGSEDRGTFIIYIYLDYGGGGQGFGGYVCTGSVGTEFIRRTLAALEVQSWEKLPGTTVRVRASHCNVHAIGHFMKDQWFDPKAEMQEMLSAHD